MPKYLLIILLLTNLRECLGTVLKAARAKDGQFPWLIQFHNITPCGGVLISPDWVLTAAQCVESQRNSIALYANGLNGTGTSQTVRVKATYIYPEFKPYSTIRDYDHNIALLKLVRSFDMCDENVRLLDIAPVRLDDDYKSCLIFGWQSTVATSSKVHAKPVQYSKVLLNSWRVCMYMHEGNASYKNVFCTMIEDEDGIRACAGNPGSPVICEDQYRRTVLLGIASWSNFSLDCGGLPTYLGVSVFRSWMWELIFGNKNMDQRETGIGMGIGACQKEHRPPGGIRAESNFLTGKFYRRDDSEEAEDRHAVSWEASVDKDNDAPKEISGVSDVARLPTRVEPSTFHKSNDYTKILGTEGHRAASDFDIVRERERQLSQYREIGQNRIDPRFEEFIAIPSQHEKHEIVAGKPSRTIVEPEQDFFDDFDLIMPDGIERFDRSAAASRIPHSGWLRIFFIIIFSHIFNKIDP